MEAARRAYAACLRGTRQRGIGAIRLATAWYAEVTATSSPSRSKVLTETLRGLERDGFILRRLYAEVPVRVECSLTPLGWTLTDRCLSCASGPTQTVTRSRRHSNASTNTDRSIRSVRCGWSTRSEAALQADGQADADGRFPCVPAPATNRARCEEDPDSIEPPDENVFDDY
jgi:HxlR-like helix-turn-helix